MKFNEESFQKALSECKIIRWQNHFKNVVKAYLKAENEQCNIANVSQRTWTVDEIRVELESIDEFKAAKHFFDEYGG